MASGIETRVPFLDYRLLELAYRLPGKAKLLDGIGKRPIKRIASRYLPDEVVYRTKVGFGLPLESWMRSSTGLGSRLDSLTARNSITSELLSATTIKKIVDDHRSGAAVHTDALWTLLALDVWQRTFFESARRTALSLASEMTH